MKLLESKKRAEASSENRSQTVSPQKKKTRDLPNLTECHSCAFKVDVCTGNNTLRLLYSEWRVVLLCKKCFSSVQSSQICSYCFSGTTSPESSFYCNHCRHSVHKACFFKYKNVAPWSYACFGGNEFSVCVDCWIPKPLAISRTRKMRVRADENVRVNDVLERGSVSRVLQDGNLILEDVNCVVEEKVEAAARAREGAMKKSLVARRAVEFANNALSLVANREEGSLNVPPKMDDAAVKVVDGSELTFELDPHLNSLPRMNSSCCLVNTSHLDCPKRWATSSVSSSCKTLTLRNASARDEHGLSGSDNKLLEDSCKSICEPSVSVGFLDSGSSTDVNLLCLGRSGMETASKDGERTAEFDGEGIGEEQLKEGEGSCSDRLINLSEDSGMELDRKQADSALHREEKCNGQRDRYFFKYSRRICSLKPILGNGGVGDDYGEMGNVRGRRARGGVLGY